MVSDEKWTLSRQAGEAEHVQGDDCREAGLCRDSVQTEPKMASLREPERSVLQYVSTGSAQDRRLQAGMG
jgi:hypothetical protein